MIRVIATPPRNDLSEEVLRRQRANRRAKAPRLGELPAVRPVAGAVLLHQGDGDDGLGLVRVVDRVAARGLGGVLPGRHRELEGTAVLAAAADRVGVAARLAFGGGARPALVLGGDPALQNTVVDARFSWTVAS
jgi:hypothetical protein